MVTTQVCAISFVVCRHSLFVSTRPSCFITDTSSCSDYHYVWKLIAATYSHQPSEVCKMRLVCKAFKGIIENHCTLIVHDSRPLDRFVSVITFVGVLSVFFATFAYFCR